MKWKELQPGDLLVKTYRSRSAWLPPHELVISVIKDTTSVAIKFIVDGDLKLRKFGQTSDYDVLTYNVIRKGVCLNNPEFLG